MLLRLRTRIRIKTHSSKLCGFSANNFSSELSNRLKIFQTDTSDQFASLKNPIKRLLSVRRPAISAHGDVPAAHD